MRVSLPRELGVTALLLLLSVLLFLVLPKPSGSEDRLSLAREAQESAQYLHRGPIRFEENSGQAASTVQFIGRGAGYLILLDSRGAAIHSGEQSPIRMNWIGSGPGNPGVGRESLPGRTHYLLGKDSDQWVRDVPSFQEVVYPAVYPGIDVVFYGRDGVIEYDFRVEAGADPAQIGMDFEGADEISLDERGNLWLRQDQAQLQILAPYVYQMIQNRKVPVAVRYEIEEGDRVGFQIESYDPSHPLTIDPVLTHSTLIGGDRSDYSRAVSVAPNGDVCIAGLTFGMGFALREELRGLSTGNGDGFITCYAPNGFMRFSTFLGGGEYDQILGLDMGEAGEIYVTGFTESDDFPVLNAHQPVKGGETDAFLTKLNARGSDILFSTFHGGSGTEDQLVARSFEDPFGDVAVDVLGNAYIVGLTSSADFPITQNAFQQSGNDNLGPSFDGFIARFDSDGDLVYSSYMGGARLDVPRDVEVDSAGRAYVVGGTNSEDFPLVNPIRATFEGDSAPENLSRAQTSEAFLLRVSADGNDLQFSTFLGGKGSDDGGAGLVVDSEDNVYVLGHTDSEDFFTKASPTPAEVGKDAPSLYHFGPPRGLDIFLLSVDIPQGEISQSALIGGQEEDIAGRLAQTPSGKLAIVGSSESQNFPVWLPIQGSLAGSFDAIAAIVTPATGVAEFSTYLGSSGTDQAYAVDFAEDTLFVSGRAFSAGRSFLRSFPQAKPNHTQGGLFSSDAFISRIRMDDGQFLGADNDQSWMRSVLLDTNLNGYPDPRDEVVSINLRQGGGTVLELASGHWGNQEFVDFRTVEGNAAQLSYFRPRFQISVTELERRNGRIVRTVVTRETSAGIRQGELGFIDQNDDGIMDAIQGGEDAGPELTISIQLLDADGDGQADFATIPWALAKWAGVNRRDVTPDPQVFVPLGDTDNDGIPDSVALDFDSDGQSDEAFPLLARIAGPSVKPEFELHFAQFGDGGGVIFSEILLYSLGKDLANVTVEMRDGEGNPLTVDLNGVVVNGQTQLQIPACNLRSLRTDGEGPIVQGSVTVRSDQPLGGVILFGGAVGLAGVGASPELGEGFYAPIEANEEEETRTGVAIKNLEDRPLNLTLRLLSATGESLATAAQDLAPLGNIALFADQAFPEIDLTNFLGVLLVETEGRITATVIQTRPGEFATFPVTTIQGGNNDIHFAHFGEGLDLIFSRLLILNLAQDDTTFQGRFFGDDGNGLVVDINGIELPSGFTAPLPVSGQGISSAVTDGAGELIAGSVLVQTVRFRRITGVLLFGGSVGVAGVGPSESLTQGFMAPIQADIEAGINTGIAVAEHLFSPLELTLHLFDADGNQLANASAALVPGGHLALFIDQIDWIPEPGIVLDFNGFNGLLKVATSGQVRAIVLQTRPGQFATMPVSPYVH